MLSLPSWLRRKRISTSGKGASRLRWPALAFDTLEDRLAPAQLSISPTTLYPLINVNTAYTPVTLTATPATGAVTYAVTAGALAPGETLTPAGVVSITPANTVAGTYNYTITATDSAVPADTGSQAYTSIVLPSQMVYDPNAQTITITTDATHPNFQLTQATVAVPGPAVTTYTFDLYNTSLSTGVVTASVPGTFLSAAPPAATGAVIVNGNGGKIVLVTNDSYTSGTTTLQTPQTFLLGSLNKPDVGSMSKFPNNDLTKIPYTFLSFTGFPDSYAYVGRNTPTAEVRGTAGEGPVGFVTAGYYSYVSSATNGSFFHEVAGAPNVYGYSAGNATDFAYHYSMNAGSSYVVSGIAFSYMSGSATNPENANATDTFFNVGAGFVENTGVSNNPGKDIAYIIDSPGSDTYQGVNGYSYMYISNGSGGFTEFDAAFAFATYYAQSFVGGRDTANANAPANNVFNSGWIRV